MKVNLSPEQLEWLTGEVAAGRYRSIDEAVACAIDVMRHAIQSDLEWARPYIEQADASLARGEGIPGDELLAHLDRKLAALQHK